MKQFLLFRGETYHAAGGWDDFAGSFDTTDEARNADEALDRADWAQVVDT